MYVSWGPNPGHGVCRLSVKLPLIDPLAIASMLPATSVRLTASNDDFVDLNVIFTSPCPTPWRISLPVVPSTRQLSSCDPRCCAKDGRSGSLRHQQARAEHEDRRKAGGHGAQPTVRSAPV